MDVKTLLDQLDKARATMTVKRVYGDPITTNDVTVIPVANVWGGAGAGAGDDDAAKPDGGSGFGFGVRATPAGVYVIKGETVAWEPALDLNRVILGGQLVAVVLIFALRAVLSRRTDWQADPSN